LFFSLSFLIEIKAADEDALRAFTETISGMVLDVLPVDVMLNYPNLKKEIVKNLQKHGRTHGLVEFELVSGLVLSCDRWDHHLRFSDGTIDREKVVARYWKEIGAVGFRK
jgi:hypothetical protein